MELHKLPFVINHSGLYPPHCFIAHARPVARANANHVIISHGNQFAGPFLFANRGDLLRDAFSRIYPKLLEFVSRAAVPAWLPIPAAENKTYPCRSIQPERQFFRPPRTMPAPILSESARTGAEHGRAPPDANTTLSHRAGSQWGATRSNRRFITASAVHQVH